MKSSKKKKKPRQPVRTYCKKTKQKTLWKSGSQIKWMGERMMKQWRKGIKIKLKKLVCRRHNRDSDRTEDPSLGHTTPKLSSPHTSQLQPRRTPEGRK